MAEEEEDSEPRTPVRRLQGFSSPGSADAPTPLGSHERGWTFNLLDTTGRYAFLFTLGSLRLARWIVFLERAKTCVAGRSALFLMQPGWLGHRPSVQRWVDLQHGRIVAVGIDA